MKIAFFGGTFDPVHRGHIRLAHSAVKHFGLGQVLFVPAHIQPLKQEQRIADYYHRFAMLTLATQQEKPFLVSDLEAPDKNPGPSYSIESIRKLKKTLRKADRLYFLLGIDAFLHIAKWHKASELLRECEFIIGSRPGFSMGEIGSALPEDLRPSKDVLSISRKQKPDFARQPVSTVALPGVTLHLIGDVWENVSATQIRKAATSASKSRLRKLVGDAVADYIQKTGIYRGAAKNPVTSPKTTQTEVAETGKHPRRVRASKSNQ